MSLQHTISYNFDGGPARVGYIPPTKKDKGNGEDKKDDKPVPPTREEAIRGGIYCPGYNDGGFSPRHFEQSISSLPKERLFKKLNS